MRVLAVEFHVGAAVRRRRRRSRGQKKHSGKPLNPLPFFLPLSSFELHCGCHIPPTRPGPSVMCKLLRAFCCQERSPTRRHSLTRKTARMTHARQLRPQTKRARDREKKGGAAGAPQGAAKGTGRSKLQQRSEHCKHTSFLRPASPSCIIRGADRHTEQTLNLQMPPISTHLVVLG